LGARDKTRFGLLARLGIVAGSLTLIVGLGFWLWCIGWPQRQVEHALSAAMNLTQKAHFSVADIEVEGRNHTAKDALANALGTAAGAPILDFDVAAAESRIAKLSWVDTVIVERRLPDTIIVRLTEREPLARWQHDNRTIVIDANGKELPEAPLEQFSNLPMVVGAGAAVEAHKLLDALKDYPEVADKMTAAVWVGLRRWDIYLTPKIPVRMPEGGLPNGLKRLSDLITDKKILDRNIASIDLRIPDQIILEPAPPVSDHAAGVTHL
jgi:cell division protein FtsQ